MLNLLSQIGIHQKTIWNHFNENVFYKKDSYVIDEPLVLIAFTNRCGSNFVAEHLKSTEKFDGFHESLNQDTVINQCISHDILNFPDYIEHLFRRKVNKHKLFGLKASGDQILMLYRWRILSMFKSIIIIHVQRNDRLAQAVSFSIADQTKKWMSTQEGLDIKPNFLPDDISGRITAAARANQLITILINLLNYPSHIIFYEVFEKYPWHQIQLVGKLCGIDLSNWKHRTPAISKQSNELNDEFVQKYRDMLLDELSSTRLRS